MIFFHQHYSDVDITLQNGMMMIIIAAIYIGNGIWRDGDTIYSSYGFMEVSQE